MMPFVTEEVWSYHPRRQGHLAVHRFPAAEESLFDPEAEVEVERGIELTRRLRAWRDMVEAPAASQLFARVEGEQPQEFVGRLARFEFTDDGGDPIAAVGPVKVLASAEIDAEAVAVRLEKRREELRSEVARAEGKLANEKFVAKAPAGAGRGGAGEARALPGRARGARRNRPAGLPRLAGADRLEARPGADAPAQHGARACPSTASPRSTSSAPTASPR